MYICIHATRLKKNKKRNGKKNLEDVDYSCSWSHLWQFNVIFWHKLCKCIESYITQKTNILSNTNATENRKMKFERISSFCFTLVLLLFHFDDVEFADVTLYKGRNCWQASWLLSILFIFHFLFRIIIIPSISSFGLLTFCCVRTFYIAFYTVLVLLSTLLKLPW